METINGWLLVYLIGSVPLLLFYSAGLSGWSLIIPWGCSLGSSYYGVCLAAGP